MASSFSSFTLNLGLFNSTTQGNQQLLAALQHAPVQWNTATTTQHQFSSLSWVPSSSHTNPIFIQGCWLCEAVPALARSWQLREVPEDVKKASVTPAFGEESLQSQQNCHLHLWEGWGSKYSWKTCPSVPRDKMIRSCQRGIMMGKSRLTNPTAFCSQAATAGHQRAAENRWCCFFWLQQGFHPVAWKPLLAHLMLGNKWNKRTLKTVARCAN